MDWSNRELEFLAQPTCSLCRGEGRSRDKRGRCRPCRCALRSIFRACYARFRTLIESERNLSHVSFDRNPRGAQRGAWGRKKEEYIADFEIIARRTLDPWHYRFFRYHHVLGADVALCARRLGVSRAAAYHALYHVESLLGLAYVTTQPYALYPLEDYFNERRAEPVVAFDPPLSRSPAQAVTLLQALKTRLDRIA